MAAARWPSARQKLVLGAARRVGTVCTPLGRVAEWQTRWLQVPVFARTWGFKSPLAHRTHTVNALVRAPTSHVPAATEPRCIAAADELVVAGVVGDPAAHPRGWFALVAGGGHPPRHR